MSLLPATKERARAMIDFFFAQSKGPCTACAEYKDICKYGMDWVLVKIHEQSAERQDRYDHWGLCPLPPWHMHATK